MPSRCDTLPGTRVRRWTVLQEAEPRGKKRYCRCRCDCGTERALNGYDLLAGKTAASCGCARLRPAEEVPVGTRYGKWTVTGPAFQEGRGDRLPCRCDCGTETSVFYFTLKSGRSSQCLTLRHGACAHGARTPEYGAWARMRAQCRAEGLPVHPSWRSYASFLRDVGERPSPGHRQDGGVPDVGAVPNAGVAYA